MEMVHDIFLFEFFDVQSMENVCHEYHKFFGHSFKKMQNMGTCLVPSVQITIFSILCPYFEVVLHGNGAQYFSFGFSDVQTMEKMGHEYH